VGRHVPQCLPTITNSTPWEVPPLGSQDTALSAGATLSQVRRPSPPRRYESAKEDQGRSYDLPTVNIDVCDVKVMTAAGQGQRFSYSQEAPHVTSVQAASRPMRATNSRASGRRNVSRSPVTRCTVSKVRITQAL
jgi:hypothetical protein